MSAQVAAPAMAAEKTTIAAAAAWLYVEYMVRRERQVERRQLFLRSHHFSRDADHHLCPHAPRRLGRGAAATGLRRLRLCFGWAEPALRRRSSSSRRFSHGFRYGRLHRTVGKAAPAPSPAPSVCFW